jgi:hypothetical protein
MEKQNATHHGGQVNSGHTDNGQCNVTIDNGTIGPRDNRQWDNGTLGQCILGSWKMGQSDRVTIDVETMGQNHNGPWDNRTVGHSTMGQWEERTMDNQSWDSGNWDNAKWSHPWFKSGCALMSTNKHHKIHRRHHQSRPRQYHHGQHSWFVHPRRRPSSFIAQKERQRQDESTLVSCGVRTHAELPPVDLKATLLTMRAN